MVKVTEMHDGQSSISGDHLKLRPAGATMPAGHMGNGINMQTSHIGVSDEELFASFIATGDSAAYTTLYQRHQPVMASYLRKFLPGQDDLIEDVIQLSFQRVIERKDQFKPGRQFSAWLYTIGANAAIDSKRYNGRDHRQTVSFEEMAFSNGSFYKDYCFDPVDTREESAPEELMIAESGERLREIIAQLGPQDQQLLTLTFYESVGYPETAAKMGLTVNAVRVRLFRLLKFIRTHLEESGQTVDLQDVA